ncbi:hypothetical protein [Blochmannia endosymbiont of Camponotus sp. C-046]|uniref:hypothetical protein n=1 Tax=Blochmannia endosymbiont of Camponotus sp. C-046 TaxID=2945589 RepID=UPI002023DA56|nr:hypothetical protein [Blochmannia endosymbiont of Camponotus sp. C-046]URJ28958.1 hypothetical protein M9409_01125 [Blochmannia endosymbiont of Camponotus sp. C-046]
MKMIIYISKPLFEESITYSSKLKIIHSFSLRENIYGYQHTNLLLTLKLRA